MSRPPQDSVTTTARTLNIADYLPRLAELLPDQAAVTVVSGRDAGGRAIYKSITFAELEGYSNCCANALASAGIERGMRTLVMVRPGFAFFGIVFALFKIGAVAVMIDPGMGVRRLVECAGQVDLHAFIGVPLAQVVRAMSPGTFRGLRSVVTVGPRFLWRGPTLDDLLGSAGDEFRCVRTSPEDTAAILFTSGSTGPAKGAVYQHGMFDAQVRMIGSHYGIRAGEIDLAAFPLFGLLSIAMGVTVVVPEIDPSRPAKVNPQRIAEAIRDRRVTTTFGSPAIWSRVATYAIGRRIRLPSLRRILIGGAPVPSTLIERLHKVLPSTADVHTPYGATESLPVSSISGRELMSACKEWTRGGAGICVGEPLPEIDVRFIPITDETIDAWSDELPVPDGQPGEIIVSGPAVTKEYFNQPRATAASKIRDGDRLWHRIGDIGYRDDRGRIWFCGRKAHRVETGNRTLLSVCCEAVFNEHPDVARSALVGVGGRGSQRPVIVIEPTAGRFPRSARRRRLLKEELLRIGATNQLTESIRAVLFRRRLPVDIRHNAKIDRELLAVWAGKRL